MKFSMEKQIKNFWVAGFFLPGINSTVFNLEEGLVKFVIWPSGRWTKFRNRNWLGQFSSWMLHAAFERKGVRVGLVGGQLPPSKDFGRYVNLISIRGGRLCPSHYYSTPPPRHLPPPFQIFRPSYGPGYVTFKNILRSVQCSEKDWQKSRSALPIVTYMRHFCEIKSDFRGLHRAGSFEVKSRENATRFISWEVAELFFQKPS